MPSPQDVKARGLGDYGDVQVGLKFHWLNNLLIPDATPGVFYLNGLRRVFASQGWYESLGQNIAWLQHYTLTAPVPERVRVDRVSIRVGNVWKDLTPLYNSVVMLYAPHWTLRPDNRWQAPINLVYPFNVYDSEGNGYYRVDELEDLGEHRYYIDTTTRSIVAPVPGLLMDGLRTSPTVEVFERVYPQPDGTVRSRWAPAVTGNVFSWAFLMYPNGECLKPQSLEGNVWIFPNKLRPQSAVIRYYVLNTYCLFNNVLEVFTEQCDEVRIWYDAADSEQPVEFYPYTINNMIQGNRLLCIVPYGVRSNSLPSSTGVEPYRIEVSDILECPQFVGRGVLCVGCTVVDKHGNGVPSVTVNISTTTSGVNISPSSVVTDIWGRAATLLELTSTSPYINLTFSVQGYPVSLTKQVGPVYSGAAAQAFCHQMVYERVVQPGMSEDLIVLYIVSSEGVPVSDGTLELRALGDASFRLINQSERRNSATIPLSELPSRGSVLLYVGKEPITLSVKVTSYDTGHDMTEMLLEDV